MKNKFLPAFAFAVVLSFCTIAASGQTGLAVNTSGASADASAMLDVQSTSQGMLLPRMTAAQRSAISSPATGLIVYQTDGTPGFYFYNGSAWVPLSGSSGTVTSVGTTDSDPLLTSTVANATTTPVITFSTTPAAGHKFFGNFTGASGAPSYSSPALNSADFANQGSTTTVLHGNAAGNPSFGQITNTDIAAGAGIVYSKLSVTSSIQPTVDFNTTGVHSATTFLRGDNTWAVPFTLTTTGSGAASFSGGTLNVPNASSGTVTTVSAGNLSPIFSTTITTPTTTPAISYTLLAAAANTVLTNSTNATAAISYGKVVPAALYDPGATLAGGKYYRGDATWQTLTTGTTTPINIVSYSGSTPIPATVNCAIAAANSLTFTLPSASSYGAGNAIYICGNNNSSSVIVNVNAGDFMRSGYTSTTNTYNVAEGAIMVCDGSHTWYVVLVY